MAEIIPIKIDVDTDELEEACEEIENCKDLFAEITPSVVIRNNKKVFVTINNFNTTHKEFMKE